MRRAVASTGSCVGGPHVCCSTAAIGAADETQTALARSLSGGTPVAEGAAFVEGLLAGSGTILLYDDALLGLLDGWVATLPDAAFFDLLPLLRRTFSSFEAAERRLIGRRVAGHGDALAPAPFGWDLDASRVDAGLATARSILGSGQRCGERASERLERS